MNKTRRSYIALSLTAILGVLVLTQPAFARGPVADENGVMMYDYGGSTGTVYNPKMVAQYGIINYDNYMETGDLQARQAVINTADWLLSSSDKGNYTLWEYGFEWSSYGGLNPPYASALAQAEGIYVLTLAYNMTGDD